MTPLVVALVLCTLVTCLHRRLPPSLGARLLALGLLVALVAALPTMWVLTAVYLWHVPQVHDAVGWCTAVVSAHHAMPPLFGVIAAGMSLVGAARAVRFVRAFRRLCQHDHASPVVSDDPEPYALTMPGRGGQVVISRGLLQLLDAPERAVVLAHERAHATCRHDRYLLLARIAERCLPPLRPISRRLCLSIERWADEHAADELGGDRILVAQTLRKVAMHGLHPTAALSFGSLGVISRIQALRAPRRLTPSHPAGVGLILILATSAAAAAYQLHHLGDLLRSLCAT